MKKRGRRRRGKRRGVERKGERENRKKEFLKCTVRTNIDSSDISRSQKIDLKETWKNKLL